MKKIILLAAFLCCMFGATAHAKTGDIVGHIYATDIRAYINGYEVPSYAIDGKTVVIIEDICDRNIYIYNDELRSLFISNLAPQSLISGSTAQAKPTGTGIGNIYETDIKTYFNNIAVTSYALNGKTAVAIEDIGGDQVFSDIGGRYKWDPEARTIHLEYFPSKRDVIDYYENILCAITLDRYDTDDYSFLYMAQGTSHGSTSILLYAKDDGTYHDFSDDFDSISLSGIKSFDKVEIDRDSKCVNIHYDKDYILDLETGMLTAEKEESENVNYYM